MNSVLNLTKVARYIQAQMGHVSPAMMKTYSHIRRKALDEAAKALEPTFAMEFVKRGERPREDGKFAPFPSTGMSHVTVTSQRNDLKAEIRSIF